MIPPEYLVPYLCANALALAVLGLAFWRRDAARWVVAAVFLWASVINAVTALTHPQAYVEYAFLTPSASYQHFIFGWFSRHVQMLVLPIAFGQLAIAALLSARRQALRWIGAIGALTFLLAIAPLGVGSGFPFSLTFGAALLVSQGVGTVVSPAARRVAWWSPRLMGVLLSGFVGLFALDAFSTEMYVFDAVRAFLIHLTPTAILLGIVLLAWHWERIGGTVFFTLAVIYGVLANGRVSWMLTISVPLILVGLLFFWSSMIPRPGRSTAKRLTV